jgi:FtsZ-binding cell division protein ZapB
MDNKIVSEVMDGKELSQIVIDLQKEVSELKDKAGKHDAELVDTKGRNKHLAKDRQKLEKAIKLWKNNGLIDGYDGRIEYEDFVKLDKSHTKEMRDAFSTDHPLLIPRVVSEIAKEAIEPNIVLTPMLQRINYTYGTQLTFPAWGAMAAGDVAEGAEYPEKSLDFAGQVVATIGKSGIAVKFSEEMIRYSLYDVMSAHLRAAGRAMVRWKEQKVATMILANAGSTNTLIDNTSASYPSSTGRNGSGQYNGTITLNDFFRAYATMINRGFVPDTLIMNPFAWQIFADEGLQRLFGFQNGLPMWNMRQGNVGNAPQWGNGSSMNGLLQNTTVTSPQNVATTYTNMPGIFPYAFRIVVSPYMPYDSVQNVTDMILCDSSQLGVLVVDEEVTTEEWNDPARDIMKIKFRERYGLGSVNNGQGSGLIKGINLAKNFDFGNNISVNFTTGDFAGNPLSGDSGVTTAFYSNNY